MTCWGTFHFGIDGRIGDDQPALGKVVQFRGKPGQTVQQILHLELPIAQLPAQGGKAHDRVGLAHLRRPVAPGVGEEVAVFPEDALTRIAAALGDVVPNALVKGIPHRLSRLEAGRGGPRPGCGWIGDPGA